MKRKLSLVILCALMMLTACVPAKSILMKEGDKTFAQLGKAKFEIPPGFRVVEYIPESSGNTMSEAMVIMAKSEEEYYTVLIFSMQQPNSSYKFLKLDLKKKYPEAFYYDGNLKYIYHAATYIAPMPMSRKLYIEDPISKVFTGYQYNGSTNRYRFDIYQNFKNQDPYQLCCGKKRKAKDQLAYLKSVQGQKEELKAFRDFSLALIKGNIHWSFSVE